STRCAKLAAAAAVIPSIEAQTPSRPSCITRPPHPASGSAPALSSPIEGRDVTTSYHRRLTVVGCLSTQRPPGVGDACVLPWGPEEDAMVKCFVVARAREEGVRTPV